MLITLILLVPGMASGAPVLDEAAKERIDSIVEEAIARKITPGAALVIGTADKVIHARGYGKFTYEEDAESITLDTIFDLASVSKAVGTASAALLLIEDGKLKLDDKVSQYIPAWDRDDKREITVRNLIGHTSGLPSYINAAGLASRRKDGESKIESVTREVAAIPLRYETNKGAAYGCLNFVTLVRVNETVAGRTQEKLLRERIFGPLGMSNTGYTLSDAQKKITAPTGRRLQGSVHDPLAAYYSDEKHSGGNAGLFTSANDLAKFCRMVLSNGKWEDKQILKPATIDLMATNSRPLSLASVFGHGWVRYSRPPHGTSLNRGFHQAVIGHGGYTGTFVRIDRLSGTYVILLTNRVYPNDNTSVSRLRSDVVRILMENDPTYKGVL